MTVFKLNDLSKTGCVTANQNFKTHCCFTYIYIYTKKKVKHPLIY